MILAVADTHAVIWYIFNDRRLPATARAPLAAAAAGDDQIAISSITLAEVVYLEEKGRVPVGTLTRLLGHLDESNPMLTEVAFDCHVAARLSEVARSDVPDMPDRIIAATALFLDIPLISRDGRIRASGVSTTW